MIKKIINKIKIIIKFKHINKFVCPECGSKVEYYKEVTHRKFFNINSRTGYVSKKVKKINSKYLYEIDQDNEGIKCFNCGWEYDFIYQDTNGMEITEELKQVKS